MTTVIEKALGTGVRLAYDANDNLEYLGLPSSQGVATSAAEWRILKLAYDGNGNMISLARADGNDNFDNIWDNRASLSYII